MSLLSGTEPGDNYRVEIEMSDTFTPRGRMIVHVDWDVRPREGRRGATSGHVWARLVIVGTGRTREFAGTEDEVTEWCLAAMTAAGAHGIACEVRDARGVRAE